MIVSAGYKQQTKERDTAHSDSGSRSFREAAAQKALLKAERYPESRPRIRLGMSEQETNRGGDLKSPDTRSAVTTGS